MTDGRLGSLRALLVGALLAAAPATAAEWVIKPDPGVSTIRFVLGATLHKVEGTARLSRGEIRFDPALGTIGGSVTADATSFETANEKRDRQMHAKVLESDAYPEIVFRPTSVHGELEPQGASELLVSGEMEIHGDSHRISLPVRIEMEPGGLRATARFVVPFVEWGMKDPSRFVLRVEKQVDVVLELVAAVETGAPPADSTDSR